MSRSIPTIKAQMVAEKNQQVLNNPLSPLALLSTNSQTSIWGLILYLCAFGINIFEQLTDLFTANQTAAAGEAVPGTAAWVKSKVLQFQYDATSPQFVVLDPATLEVKYEVPDPTLRIITRCAVVTTDNRKALVKAAKSEPPVALTSLELTALQSMINPLVYATLGFAGIDYQCISAEADKLEIAGIIYFQGQYASIIQANVEAALNAYMAALPFDGTIVVSKVEDAIQAVTGVNTVNLSKVRLRQDSAAFPAGLDLYNLASGTNLVSRSTFAGYVVNETESGHTFADTLTYQGQ